LKWYRDMLWFSTLELPALWKEEQEKVNLMVGAASGIVEGGRGQDWRLLQTSSPWIIHSALIEIKRKKKSQTTQWKVRFGHFISSLLDVIDCWEEQLLRFLLNLRTAISDLQHVTFVWAAIAIQRSSHRSNEIAEKYPQQQF
jgi:hypothetical protein